MGQAISTPYTCPQCRGPFPQSSKHCPSCGYANHIFISAARYGVPSPSRSSTERAAALQAAPADSTPCAYCAWPIRKGQMYCNECGHPQPATEDPAWTPRTRQLMLRSPSARSPARRERDLEQLDDRRAAEVPHPMGVEALVTPTGRPTRKLEALSNALFTLLTSSNSNALTGSHSKKQLVDIPRLNYLEHKLGRRPEYMLSSFDPSAVLAVYKSMNLEHTLVPFPPPAQQLDAPCLTRLGLMQYLQHGILFDPHEAVRELQQLVADTPELPAPPAWLANAQVRAGTLQPGGKGAWIIEENMALSKPHPLAEQRQEKVLIDLEQMGFPIPGDPPTPRRRRRRPEALAAPLNSAAAGGMGEEFLSPHTNPYHAFPWGSYPSPYTPYTPYAHLYAHPYQSPMPWAAYPPHPYSPQRSPYRLSPALPQDVYRPLAGGAGAGVGGSPRARALAAAAAAEEDWDYRDFEDIR
ncbi:hypothetical protein DACRYDRAFT_113516 [Dacryopinax primogenitus]|uniref:DUF7514 domain-containing protein n=1 Tax=Dacryopinax primogenitus (strain DJM 731) TaxID=1858805 RepID=M5GAJ3_DACPD|nr:uncharacterized protein DACRYDRAFT_113516 [Dacryopinax primogenitus]EJU05375.1 hypothetical protein DACRYDRAFT_113516 [Dacryopinax primogenitus]